MRRKQAIKSLLVGSLCFLTLGLASCGGQQNGTTPTYQAFLMGVQEEMRMGDSILIEDLIGEMEKGTYTMTATCGSENVDLSGKITWTPSALGEWLITYTILEGENQGTYTHTINVVSLPYIVVSHMQEAMPFLYEQEMSFAEFFDAQNIAVTSHNDGMWEPIMVSVHVDGQIIKFDETQTSYKLQSLSDHYFTYKIRTTDGRERKLIGTVQVKYSFDETDLWLDENDNGQYAIDVENVASIKINNKECLAADVEITDTSVVFSEETLHDKYSGVNNISLQTQSGEEKRYVLNVYTEAFDMENGIPSDIFFFKDSTTNAAMKLTEYNGSKAMSLWGESKWQRFYISREYIDFIFSNPNIDLFTFDLTVDFSATTGATFIQLHNAAANIYVNCDKGKTLAIEVSRLVYEGYENELGIPFTFMNQAGNTGTVKLTWYIDNMRGFDTPVVAHFNDRRVPTGEYGKFIQPTRTSEQIGTSNEWADAGYLGETTPYYQKTAWVNKSGKTGESGDYAYYLQFGETHTGRPKHRDVYGYSVAFLDEVFADVRVQALTWDYIIKTKSTGTYTLSTNVDAVTEVWNTGFTDSRAWETLTITRSQYEAIKAANVEFLTVTITNTANADGSWDKGINVYHDNVMRVYAEQVE